jgi:hypothetical protein
VPGYVLWTTPWHFHSLFAVNENGGADGDRTHDFSIANAALSQLSYGPTPGSGWYLRGRWGASGSMG